MSKMTNEELAVQLEAIPPFLMKEARHLTDSEGCLREAAERLRRIDERTSQTCYLRMKSGVCSCYSCKRDGDCDNCEYGDIREWAANDANTIADLRRRLKIAEESLSGVVASYDIVGTDPDTQEDYGTIKESAYMKAKKAIEAIREGGK